MSKKLLKNCIVCNVEFTSFPSQKQKLCSLNCSHINQSIIMSGRPSHRRGKTIEEICGEEKGKELRKWYSQKYSGSGNSNYGGIFHGNRKLASKNARKSRLDRIKKDGYTDKEIKCYSDLSNRMRKNNPMHNIKSFDKHLKSTVLSGRNVYTQGIYNSNLGVEEYYQSSYELEMMKLLDSIKNIVWSKKHIHRINYIDENGNKRKYIPDFMIYSKNNAVMLEVKGRETKTDILKYKAASNYCKKRNYNYMVTGENTNIRYINDDVLYL